MEGEHEELFRTTKKLWQINPITGERSGRTYNKHSDPNGYEFYRTYLNDPKYVMAPMVDGSELAFRLMGRAYGVQLAYSPMLISKLLAQPKHLLKYMHFSTNDRDSPLIVQICGNDPEIVAAACRRVEPYCEAIDLNLGCPQRVAKRGNYGSFLLDKPDLVYSLVTAMNNAVEVPIFCKMRIKDSLEQTIDFARGLEARGCKCLAVHGRTREQKGKGVANWDYIREVKRHLSIPVIANGSVNTLEDAKRCLEYTGCDGVMSATGILNNPALFNGEVLEGTSSWPRRLELAREYLAFAKETDAPRKNVEIHLFHILNDMLGRFPDLRTELERGRLGMSLDEILNQLDQGVTAYLNGDMAVLEKVQQSVDELHRLQEQRRKIKESIAAGIEEPLPDPSESCVTQ